MSLNRIKSASLTAGLIAFAGPALAHLPLAGAPMETFTQGALSGIGHPVLGFDHLFFVVLVGIAALYTARPLATPLAYIGAMLLGTLAMAFGLALPMIEPMIIASLIILGFVVLSGTAISAPMAIGLFAVAGLFHGSAFGESIALQEAGMGAQVLLGYLLGLGLVQYGIAISAGKLLQRVSVASAASAVAPRLTGAALAGVGVFLAFEALEGAAFSALGLS